MDVNFAALYDAHLRVDVSFAALLGAHLRVIFAHVRVRIRIAAETMQGEGELA